MAKSNAERQQKLRKRRLEEGWRRFAGLYPPEVHAALLKIARDLMARWKRGERDL